VLVIGDSSVSNFHASFTIAADGALWLSDVGSSNGTWVNGAPVGANNRIQVHDGDRLRFGDVEATLHLSLDQASPA
jgi:pSer/pThr/pTyr-binding forkhead associated (FHA) protein